ncbi:unnamed protein product, partial [Pleuronectes platessa]
KEGGSVDLPVPRHVSTVPRPEEAALKSVCVCVRLCALRLLTPITDYAIVGNCPSSVPPSRRFESLRWALASGAPTSRVKGGRREIMSDHDGPTTAQRPPCR